MTGVPSLTSCSPSGHNFIANPEPNIAVRTIYEESNLAFRGNLARKKTGNNDVSIPRDFKRSRFLTSTDLSLTQYVDMVVQPAMRCFSVQDIAKAGIR